MLLRWSAGEKIPNQETSQYVCLVLDSRFSELLGTDTLWSAVCSQCLLPFLFPVREVGWMIALQGMPTCQMLSLKG